MRFFPEASFDFFPWSFYRKISRSSSSTESFTRIASRISTSFSLGLIQRFNVFSTRVLKWLSWNHYRNTSRSFYPDFFPGFLLELLLGLSPEYSGRREKVAPKISTGIPLRMSCWKFSWKKYGRKSEKKYWRNLPIKVSEISVEILKDIRNKFWEKKTSKRFTWGVLA